MFRTLAALSALALFSTAAEAATVRSVWNGTVTTSSDESRIHTGDFMQFFLEFNPVNVALEEDISHEAVTGPWSFAQLVSGSFVERLSLPSGSMVSQINDTSLFQEVEGGSQGFMRASASNLGAMVNLNPKGKGGVGAADYRIGGSGEFSVAGVSGTARFTRVSIAPIPLPAGAMLILSATGALVGFRRLVHRPAA
jgi:hypothetical protein